MSSSKSFVKFDKVDKSYDGKTLVVKDLNLDINEGEFITMLGPSGSGKTTCLMMLAGFETPTNGEIYLDSKPISKIPPHNEISPPQGRCMYVDSEDEDQIIEALKYISVNLNKSKKSRSLSRQYSIKNFSVNNMLSTYKEIYKSL